MVWPRPCYCIGSRQVDIPSGPDGGEEVEFAVRCVVQEVVLVDRVFREGPVKGALLLVPSSAYPPRPKSRTTSHGPMEAVHLM